MDCVQEAQSRGEGMEEERKRKGREEERQVVELGRSVDEASTGRGEGDVVFFEETGTVVFVLVVLGARVEFETTWVLFAMEWDDFARRERRFDTLEEMAT